MPLALRPDFNADALRAIARKTKDGPQARRCLALATLYEGATRTEAARMGGVTRQIIRDWGCGSMRMGPRAWSTASRLDNPPSSPTPSGLLSPLGSMRARSPRFTAWCAGVWSI